MLWRYIEIKTRRIIYPNLFFFEEDIAPAFKRSIYKKYGFGIRFDTIPENYPEMLYLFFFGIEKGMFYPTDDNIKFFYFTRFKKNGFLFIIFCIILYRNCFFEFVLLLIKGFIGFYIIVDLIYIIFFIRKWVKIIIKSPRIILLFLTYIHSYLKRLRKWVEIIIESSGTIAFNVLLTHINSCLNKLLRSNEKWYF